MYQNRTICRNNRKSGKKEEAKEEKEGSRKGPRRKEKKFKTQKGDAKRKDSSAVETEHKERTRKAKTAKETKVTESNIEKQIHVYESVTDVRSEETEGNSRKKASEKSVKKDETKERQKRCSISDGHCESTETKEGEINNNCVESRPKKELTSADIGIGERHGSYISTEE